MDKQKQPRDLGDHEMDTVRGGWLSGDPAFPALPGKRDSSQDTPGFTVEDVGPTEI